MDTFMKNIHYLSILLCSMLITSMTACSWVKLTPDGEDVRILFAEDITNCKLLGSTTASLKSKIAGFERNQEKVQQELNTLGRNSAANLAGNTIVAASDIKDGQQTFKVYQCVNTEK